MKRWILLLLVIFSFHVISAEVTINPVSGVYNIGDETNLELTLRPATSTSGFLIIDLVCGENSRLIQQSPYTLEAFEEKNVNVEIVFRKNIIGDLSGNCYFRADFVGETARTDFFEISRSIDANVNINTGLYSPGDSVVIEGTANLKNGKSLSGFAELILFDNSSQKQALANGSFSLNFSISYNMPAGKQNVIIKIYDMDGEEIGNSVEVSRSIEVKQILKGISLNTSLEEVTPGEDYIFQVSLFDQAGSPIDLEIYLRYYDSNNRLFKEELVRSGEKHFTTEYNYSAGYWKVEARVQNLAQNLLFYMKEKQLAKFDLQGDVLTVHNLGNVRYSKVIEVIIGDHSEFKEIDLATGEQKQFKITAPEDQYSITVKEGETAVLQGSSLLTGRAIGVGEVGSGNIVWQVLIGVLVILVILSIIVYFRLRALRKNRQSGSSMSSNTSNRERKLMPYVSGKKEEASVAVFTSKSPALDSMLLEEARKNKARVYMNDDYRVVFFTPSLTRSTENEKLAVKFAKDIETMMQQTADVKNIGVGIHSGEVIIESHGSEIKITSLGSVVAMAKRLSSKSLTSGKGILVNTIVARRVGGDIKTELIKDDVHRVVGIIDREKHQGFVKGFLDRQKKGSSF